MTKLFQNRNQAGKELVIKLKEYLQDEIKENLQDERFYSHRGNSKRRS